MDAGASGVPGHAVQKFVAEMFLHKTDQDITIIQCQCLVANFVMEKEVMFKFLHAIIAAPVLRY